MYHEVELFVKDVEIGEQAGGEAEAAALPLTAGGSRVPGPRGGAPGWAEVPLASVSYWASATAVRLPPSWHPNLKRIRSGEGTAPQP